MDSVKELWSKMLTGLEIEISAINFDTWVYPLEPVNIIDNKLVLVAPTEHFCDFVKDKFKEPMLRVMSSVNPLMSDILIIGPSERESYVSDSDKYTTVSTAQAEEIPVVKTEANFINPKYNFENFVVGSSNKFMYAAARAVSEEPGVRYNPLFVYGGAGLGKTHIMHAIGNAIKVSHPTKKVLYVSSETFISEFIASIRAAKGESSSFREKYRGVDVLMIDDIQFITGRPETQDQMFHTFNELYQANKQLIFSSDRPPKEISDIEERLRSRFEWGLIVDVQPPDLETRIAILQKKAQIEKYNIPLDVLTLMAEKLSNNIRDMESLLNKVIFLSRLYETSPTVDLVTEALKDYADRSDEAISPESVISCTCKYFNINREDLVGKKKNREIVEPRQICIYVITELLSLPLAAIGEIFGGRDHTTVMHARDKVASSLTSNIKTKVAVQDIKDMVLKK